MDYLQATTPSGFLHASTCDSPRGYGETFRQIMERQGLTVTRYSMQEYRQLYAAPGIEQRTETQPETLPEVGAEIVTPLLGRCTVTHVLSWPDGTRTAVARGAKGEGMVREWEAAPSVQPSMEPTPVPELPVAGGWHMPSLFDLGTA